MLVRVRYVTAFVEHHVETAEPVVINLDGLHDTTFVLRRANEDEQGAAGKLVCEVRARWETGPDLDQVLRDIDAGRLPASLKGREFAAQSGLMLDGDIVPFEQIPAGYEAFVREVTPDLFTVALSCLRLFRWRYDLPGSSRPIESSLGDEWSSDGAQWHRLPSGLTAHISAVGFRRLAAADAAAEKSWRAVVGMNLSLTSFSGRHGTSSRARRGAR